MNKFILKVFDGEHVRYQYKIFYWLARHDPLGRIQSPNRNYYYSHLKLIHSADPQSRTIVITNFADVSLRTYVLQNLPIQNKGRLKIIIASGRNVVLAEGIVDYKCLVDPLGQPTVTAICDHCFHTCCPSVRPHFSNLENKTTENNVGYWRDYGSGRVDHWWHLSCITYFMTHHVGLFSDFLRHLLAKFSIVFWVNKELSRKFIKSATCILFRATFCVQN